jgi:hypothetical protein
MKPCHSAGLLHYGLNFPFSDKSINDRKDVQSVSLVKLGDFQDAFLVVLSCIGTTFMMTFECKGLYGWIRWQRNMRVSHRMLT